MRRRRVFSTRGRIDSPMSIDQAETLKRELTDKYVVVAEKVPELRRFVGLTGRVKTVNMSGRALVQFDGPVDIGWYDISPSYLRVVDAPLPKPEPVHAKAAPAEKPAATKPAAAPAAKGKSPLELAREQAAKKAAGAPTADAAAPAPAKKLSPLELARQQGAAKAAGAAPAPKAEAAPVAEEAAAAPDVKASAAAPVAAEKPAATPKTGPDGRKLSPLELARMQGAVKKKE